MDDKFKKITEEDVTKLLNQIMTIEEYARQRIQIEQFLKDIYDMNKLEERNNKTVFYF